MRTSRRLSDVRGVGVLAAMTIVFLAGVLASTHESSSGQAAEQVTEALRIDVTLDEYSFSPEPLTIPAGREVTLVITNVGEKSHEFMAGRDVQGNDFREDLFADLHVNIEQVSMRDTRHEAHATAAESSTAATDTPDGESADHGHDAEHAHGTMVENQPGETFLMTFTLPESRRGEWTTGCFLPGHYAAGMHGTLIVK